MIGRTVFRASRTSSLGFVIAPPSLQFPKQKSSAFPTCSNSSSRSAVVSACTRLLFSANFSQKSGLNSPRARIAAARQQQQVHAVSSDSNSSSPALVADDENEEAGESPTGTEALEDEENGVSPLRKLCAGKVPEYLLRR